MSNETLLTGRAEFAALLTHHAEMVPLHMKDMLASDPARFDFFHAKQPGILFDYSRHRINAKTIALLMDLAKSCDIEGWREKMFSGEKINTSENRAVLHPALRGSVDKNLFLDGENVSGFVNTTLERMKGLSQKIRAEKKFTDIVNLGIGGSDLGTRTVYEALEPLRDGPRVHFAANIDGAALAPILQKLDPEKTLFLLVSKSFTTLETQENGKAAKAWLERHKIPPEDHFIAVTENTKEAKNFGVKEENIFPLRKWIGGRYSVWSAVGLPLAIAFGFENFKKFLDGAHAMDRHFLAAPLEQNIPVLMALLGIWYRNFFDFRAHAVLPYAQNLRSFPSYLQQLDMESNGKRVSRAGHALNYETGPVIFGEPGTNAQHAFFQALHQGTDIIPADFILTHETDHDLPGHHAPLNANALAQAQGLMSGLENAAEPHRHYPGNRPSSTLILDRLDPWHIGLLLALYEHKIFVQGIVWGINSFDQWGVELGKVLSNNIRPALENQGEIADSDSTVKALVAYLSA